MRSVSALPRRMPSTSTSLARGDLWLFAKEETELRGHPYPTLNVWRRRPEDFCSAPERNLLNERPSLEYLAMRLNLGVMESLTQEYTNLDSL
jgi:hypothetical protein